MQTTEEIAAKIKITTDLGSVVKTMKTLAMVNIRQYLEAVDSLDDYYKTVELGLRILSREMERDIIETAPEGKNLGAVIFGSDQGLSGRFNDEILDYSIEQTAGSGIEKDRRFNICIGERLNSIALGKGLMVDESLNVPRSVVGITPAVAYLITRIDEWREEKELGRVILFHNRQKGKASYVPSSVNLFPYTLQIAETEEGKRWPFNTVPIITIDPAILFRSLVRQYFFVTLFRAYAQSLASENASRLASMQAAEKNIDERLENLTSQFRSQRQTAITQELMETVAGFEALTTSE
jgi:F-type H+-transporting ATPase subunit gamma